MKHSVAAENRKVRPLNRMIPGTPQTTVRNPPAALPSICSALPVPLMSEDARSKSPAGTSCGIRLLTAGWNSAVHTALTAATASTCQTCMAPHSASPPSASMATPQTASLPIISARLLHRSASAPPNGCSTSAPK